MNLWYFFSISLISLYSKESTKASQEASITSQLTPIVVQISVPSVDSIKTRTLAAVADFPSRTRTL